jgi:hypothetical protein
MKLIKWVFWFIWGLPQNLIGLGLFMYYYITKGKKHVSRINDAFIINLKHKGAAISLGQFIIIWGNYKNVEYIEKHEYGHTIQSHILGPLYLIVVGLPSIIWNRFFREYRRKNKVGYYDVYPENWANKLGGNK